ncbi:Regulatory activator SdiA [Klebsiella pneumoniae]|nr:Regulatory activator SdiA [Klebsiella pneumoniae]
MLHQFQSMATGEEVYNLLQRETEALEYDYYTLCVRHPVPFTRPRVTFQSTYPAHGCRTIRQKIISR